MPAHFELSDTCSASYLAFVCYRDYRRPVMSLTTPKAQQAVPRDAIAF